MASNFDPVGVRANGDLITERNYLVLSASGAPGGTVTSVSTCNDKDGNITITGGTGVTVVTSGQTITINAPSKSWLQTLTTDEPAVSTTRGTFTDVLFNDTATSASADNNLSVTGTGASYIQIANAGTYLISCHLSYLVNCSISSYVEVFESDGTTQVGTPTWSDTAAPGVTTTVASTNGYTNASMNCIVTTTTTNCQIKVYFTAPSSAPETGTPSGYLVGTTGHFSSQVSVVQIV